MTWIAFACAGLAVAVFIVLAYVRRWRWTGFAAEGRSTVDDEQFQPAKTLWDWLQLLVIPLALAVLAFLLNNSQTNREQRREDERAARQSVIAADAAREEALRGYLTQMSGLILDRELLRSRPDDDVRAVARTVTLTTLRRVDGERRGLVVQFLAEARLLSEDDPKVGLEDADLRSADLRGAWLLGVNLFEANLAGADLAGAYLASANLSGTRLVGANLARATLAEARLPLANLAEASLKGAHLKGASLAGANLKGANLERADLGGAALVDANLEGADLREARLDDAEYTSRTTWPTGEFDPARRGALEVPPPP